MDLEFRAKFKPSRGSYWKQEYAWRPSVYKVPLLSSRFDSRIFFSKVVESRGRVT